MRTVSLLTDFGLKDPFVGMMKAVVLSRAARDVAFIDLTHDVPPQDVRTGAFFLRAAAPFLPPGSLTVAVVDPGVGSARRILWARTSRGSFLAPDNGLLSWLKAPLLEVRRVENRSLALPEVLGTFQGRDVFAPVAGALLAGVKPAALGPRTRDYVRLPAPRVKKDRKIVRGEIVAADRFGNCWTSLESKALPVGGKVFFRGKALGPVRGHYAEVPTGRPLAVAGSFGVVELSVRNGDFARRFRARPGDEVAYHV